MRAVLALQSLQGKMWPVFGGAIWDQHATGWCRIASQNFSSDWTELIGKFAGNRRFTGLFLGFFLKVFLKTELANCN